MREDRTHPYRKPVACPWKERVWRLLRSMYSSVSRPLWPPHSLVFGFGFWVVYRLGSRLSPRFFFPFGRTSRITAKLEASLPGQHKNVTTQLPLLLRLLPPLLLLPLPLLLVLLVLSLCHLCCHDLNYSPPPRLEPMIYNVAPAAASPRIEGGVPGSILR